MAAIPPRARPRPRTYEGETDADLATELRVPDPGIRALLARDARWQAWLNIVAVEDGLRVTGTPGTSDLGARPALLEALGVGEVAFEREVLVPWAGNETWQLHLTGLAMHEGACAHALREGDPLPEFAEG